MSRTKTREFAVISLYQMDVHSDYSIENAKSMMVDDKKLVVGFYEDLVVSFVENQEKIDGLIEKHLNDWKLDRISKIELAILRIAVTELEIVKQNPYKVIVNEAIVTAKKFSDEESGKFINGVLSNFSVEEKAKLEDKSEVKVKPKAKKKPQGSDVEVSVRKKRKVEVKPIVETEETIVDPEETVINTEDNIEKEED